MLQQMALNRITRPAGLHLTMIALFRKTKHQDEPHCYCDKGFTIIKAAIDLSEWQDCIIFGIKVSLLDLFQYGLLDRLVVHALHLEKIADFPWRLKELCILQLENEVYKLSQKVMALEQRSSLSPPENLILYEHTSDYNYTEDQLSGKQQIEFLHKPVQPQWLYSIKINTVIQISDWKLDIQALIDTGCSNTILDMALFPQKYHVRLDPADRFHAEQMDGQLFLYEYILAKHKLSFSLGNAHYTPPSYIGRICLRPLSLVKTKFIIGLNLLINSYKGVTLTTEGLIFLPHLTL